MNCQLANTQVCPVCVIKLFEKKLSLFGFVLCEQVKCLFIFDTKRCHPQAQELRSVGSDLSITKAITARLVLFGEKNRTNMI